MILRPDDTDRAWELIDAVCTDESGDEALRQLDSRLRDDPVACDLYNDYCQLHAALMFNVKNQESFAAFQASFQASAPVPILGPASGGIQGSFGYLTSGWPVAYLVATVIFGVGALVGALVHVSQPASVVHQSVAVPSTRAQLPCEVGRITGIVECVWEGSGFRGQGSVDGTKGSALSPLLAPPLRLGDRLALRSGLLEITYDTGAKVILQGPVTYEVESAAGGYLSVGKLTAKLEKSSAVSGQQSETSNPQSPIPNASPSPQPLAPSPFVVTTPTAVVTDLGTEFGVEVDQSGSTTSHVFVGRVKMQSAIPAEETQGHAILIEANESAHAEKTGADGSGQSIVVRRVRVTASGFIRAMPPNARAIPSPDDYASLVLALQPAVYYRMEPTGGAQGRDVVFDLASGCHGALAFSNAFGGSPYTTGRIGHSLRFRGAMAGDHVTAPRYPPSVTGQLAACAWVRATARETWGAVAATWGRHPTGQFFLGFYRDSGQMSAGLIQRDGREVWARPSESTESFPYGKWQHVAFSTDGTTLRFYLNGVEVGSCRHDGLLQKPGPAKLTIGCAIDDATPTETDERYFCHWSGRIDELAVFNHPLTADQIMALYRGK